MAVITKIEAQKRKEDRVNIYVDEKFFMAIYKELVFTFNLKKGDNIDEEYLKKILKDEMFLKCKNKALNILSKASQSEKKIREKLNEDFEEDAVDDVIDFLKKYNFINDGELASKIVNTNVNLNKYGKNKIKQNLYNKGIEKSAIDEAISEIDSFGYPVVIKADGLAAGKGVVIVENKEDAISTLKDMMVDGALDGAGSKVVLEEFLTGFECSLLCFTDGKTIVPMVSAKDHKQIFDGNKGPNTGGMGTVSPNPFLPEGMDEVLKKDILDPFMQGLKDDQMDYRGVVFIGLMIENNQAKVLEFNVRFGDPETQSILLRLESDLYEIMDACATYTLDQVEVKWSDDHVACLVLASGGYPGKYDKGIEIKNIDKVSDDIVVFHAGTALKDGKLVTNGGRVLNVCARGANLQEALAKVYETATIITFDGMYYRHDIGLR